MPEQPLFFFPFRVADEEKAGAPVLDTKDCTGEIRVPQAHGPAGIRREKAQQDAVDANRVGRVYPAPLDLMDTEPGAVSVRQVLSAIAMGGVA